MSDLTVQTRAGKVRGKKENAFDGTEFCSFKGIPYAEPPIGELRFRDPQPLKPWTGVRETTSHGSNCAQKDFLTKEIIGNDDCLYLNVYARSIASKQRWPVMVWIHGGAFVGGSGDETFYGPDFFMRKDVVLVTINYRLGVLGFLNLDDEVATGNQGLKDQVMALQWVRDNIGNFGGDADNVTIFGESAGGGSVHYLTLSSLAKGLFHKAIPQSGLVVNPWAHHSNIKEKAYRLCEKLGHTKKDPKSIVQFLRTIDAKKLAEAQEDIVTNEEKIQFIFSFGPSIDSKSKNPFMPVHPDEAAANGIKVPVMIGYTSREGICFLKELSEVLDEYPIENEKILPTNAKDAYKKFYNLSPDDLVRIYFNDESMTSKNPEGLVDFTGDTQLIEGIHRALKTQINKKCAPTYFYVFTYDKEPSFLKVFNKIETMSGASHGDELSFLFRAHIMDDKVELPKKGSEKYKIIEQMIELWVNFATVGKPTPTPSELIPVNWLPVDAKSGLRYLNICENLRMEVATDISEQYRARKYPKHIPLSSANNRAKRSYNLNVSDLIVETRAGKVRGERENTFDGTEFCSFKGIPYAEPPIGQLRFRDPQPLKPWKGIREATSHGSNCCQKDFFTKEIIGSDDCLYLNVYARKIESGARRPVMVWIYGGGFVIGHADDSVYAPDYFMWKNVILVTINYRLGVLGFLNLDDEVATGNQGLKDQVMALQWVRDNIANFGGDADNVTIFGESAGAASVHFLCLSSLAKGLFHKAILQSGVVLNPWAFHSNLKDKAYRLCERLGHTKKDPKSIIEFLREIDVKKLIEAQENIATMEEKVHFEYSFGPSIDSESKIPLIPTHPEKAYAAGINVPLIIGYNSREGLSHLKKLSEYILECNLDIDKIIPSSMKDILKERYNLTTKDLKQIYFGNEPITKQNLDKLTDLFGDLRFIEGIQRTIKIQIDKKCVPTYVYQFTYDKEPSVIKSMDNIQISGASHIDDLEFLFRGQFGETKVGLPKKDSVKHKITEQMIALWVNFATTGKPTPKPSTLLPIDWQPVNEKSSLRYLNICENLRMEVALDLGQQYLARKYPKHVA